MRWMALGALYVKVAVTCSPPTMGTTVRACGVPLPPPYPARSWYQYVFGAVGLLYTTRQEFSSVESGSWNCVSRVVELVAAS